MTEEKKMINNKDIINYLAEKFPLCFFVEGEAKPLKIGLFKDLAEALSDDKMVSKTQLRQALRKYTSNWRYLHGCREGAVRVDLYGNPCGVLEKEHVEHAATKLSEAKAKLSEKMKENRLAKQKNNKNNVTNNRTSRKTTKKKVISDIAPININLLEKNEYIKVKVGHSMKKAKVLDILKDNVRIELDNGLVITVTADRLFK